MTGKLLARNLEISDRMPEFRQITKKTYTKKQNHEGREKLLNFQIVMHFMNGFYTGPKK